MTSKLLHISHHGLCTCTTQMNMRMAVSGLTIGVHVQIWHTPGFAKVFAPMRLHRTIGTCHDDITALDWSPNGQFIGVACKDLTVR